MKLFADLTKPAFVNPNNLDWVPSPLAGVDRRMLERDGDEVARATTIVRYAPDSFFSAHSHTGGEEYYVLEGTFSDESGDYPAGYYVRNPIGSSHKPFTKGGCKIYVKLRQMVEADQSYVSINTLDVASKIADGVKTQTLHQFEKETVLIRSLQAGETYTETSQFGLEILVLSGQVTIEGQTADAECWQRLPGEQSVSITSSKDTRLLIKKDHL